MPRLHYLVHRILVIVANVLGQPTPPGTPTVLSAVAELVLLALEVQMGWLFEMATAPVPGAAHEWVLAAAKTAIRLLRIVLIRDDSEDNLSRNLSRPQSCSGWERRRWSGRPVAGDAERADAADDRSRMVSRLR